MTLTYMLLKQLLSPLDFTLVKTRAIALKKRKYKEEQFHVSLVRKTTCNIKVLVDLGRPPFKIYIETQMLKCSQRLPFWKENTYLRKTINEEIKITNLDCITNLKYISDPYGLSNFMINIFKAVEGNISKKDCKNKHNFFQTRDTDSFIQENFFTYSPEKMHIFTQTKDQYKKKTSMNLKDYDNRVAITKLKLSSHNMAINMAKWYKLPDD